MFRLFEPRSTLDRLREKYSCLMRRAYEVALLDKSKSDLLNDKACKILQEIRQMEHQELCKDK
ncbi:Lacal_2735 family protein [Salinimicrobium marinum]|uniref:Lacal_2735 family protein n=1 Tax=Salinimicrobium marinum TaxID=680283 RepID=UPI0016763FAE|nr:Lacal_2735 family protein [Salinimicrobium marinum]